MFLFPPPDGVALVWSLGRGEEPVGGRWTLNTSECPNDAVACSLSDILEANVHPRFFLSPRAAAGILRRAEARGRELPESLRLSLRSLASLDQGPMPKARQAGTSSSTPSTGSPADPTTTAPRQGTSSHSSPLGFHLTQDPVSGDVVPAMGRKSTGNGVQTGSTVRRLTPTECEKLMSWPDGWTVLP
jgi:hypothetical protein